MCEWQNCQNFGVFLSEDENQVYCKSHLPGRTLPKGTLSVLSRRILKEKPLPDFILQNAFTSSCLFWLTQKELDLPLSISDCLGEMADCFKTKFFCIQNGKQNKLRNIFSAFCQALREVIYNIDINETDLFSRTLSILLNYHSEKQSALANILLKNLNEIETNCKMPKIATKNIVTTVSLEVVKQNFISKFFMKDLLNLAELYSEFLSDFQPFFESKPGLQIFQNIETEFQVKTRELISLFSEDLENTLKEIWVNQQYQRVSIYVSEINKDQPILFEENPVVLSNLILCKTSVKLVSVTKLSYTDLILTLNENNNSILVYYSDRKSYLLKVFPNTEVLCAEGSDEANTLLYLKNQRKAAIYKISNFQLVKQNEIDLKLLKNEEVLDLVFVQSPQIKSIFSTDKFPLSSVGLKGPRAFINLPCRSNKLKFHLYQLKELILLNSFSDVFVFSDSLEILQVLHLSFCQICHVQVQEKKLMILGQASDKILEICLDVKLNYEEPWSIKSMAFPRSSETLLARSYTGVEFYGHFKDFSSIFARV